MKTDEPTLDEMIAHVEKRIQASQAILERIPNFEKGRQYREQHELLKKGSLI